jgi:hypothetical protein
MINIWERRKYIESLSKAAITPSLSPFPSASPLLLTTARRADPICFNPHLSPHCVPPDTQRHDNGHDQPLLLNFGVAVIPDAGSSGSGERRAGAPSVLRHPSRKTPLVSSHRGS